MSEMRGAMGSAYDDSDDLHDPEEALDEAA